ncbi:MAG: hypothetical protein GY847_18075 [Proteobacteria bacterium]|nr:hypothetical protein [Pseudomonadota bacterium]
MCITSKICKYYTVSMAAIALILGHASQTPTYAAPPDRVVVCHVSPDAPWDSHDIEVPQRAANAHLRHHNYDGPEGRYGDHVGSCNICGDGFLDYDEYGGGDGCDDGNTLSGDGCSDTCTIEPWIVQYGTYTQDMVTSVSVDDNNDVFVAGFTWGDLGGGNAGDFDAYVIKLLGKDGSSLWIKQFDSGDHERANSVSVDSNGDVLIAGLTYGDLGGGTMGAIDAYVMKLSGTNGDVLWLEQFGTATHDRAFSVSVDGNDDVLVTGHTWGNLDGGGSAGSLNAFVRKLSRMDGSMLWSEQFDSGNNDEAYSVSVDSNNDVLFAGTTEGVLGGSASGGKDAYVMKLSGIDGAVLWNEQFGTGDEDIVNSVILDGGDDVLVAGYTYGDLFGEGIAGDRDAYVTKLSGLNGNMMWAKQIGTSVYDSAYSVSVTKNDDVLIAGNTYGDLFGVGNAGGIDAYVLKLSGADGTDLWTNQFGTSANDTIKSACVDGNGHMLVAGVTEGDLGGSGNAGAYDGYVVKLVNQ